MSGEAREVLDLDGNPVTADLLVARVRRLAGESSRPRTVRRARTGASPFAASRSPELVLRAQNLQNKQWLLRPPEAKTLRGGLPGWMVTQAKRLVQRAIWWHSEPRWQAQVEIDGDVAWLAAQLARRVVTLEERVETMTPVMKAAEEFAARLASEQRSMEDVRGRLATVQALLEAAGLGAADVAPMNYVDFEDKFRGSSDDLKRLQKDYVAYFGDPGQPGLVVDIGCGRGEMLELLEDAGHEAFGIDSDSGMVLLCQRKGLAAEQDDALAWLLTVSAGTLKGIFCAQVIEHLPTRDVQRFVALAAQALQPGGTLIVETIDPRSSHAMGHHFWADLSHVKPVHPATLAYLCELEGFADVAVVPRSRHELADAADELPEGPERRALHALLESVFGYQDFALVARR